MGVFLRGIDIVECPPVVCPEQQGAVALQKFSRALPTGPLVGRQRRPCGRFPNRAERFG